ncbi:MAG TPA: sigma-70 family RNA polymerase sigma factor [bacterium]|nr:sigma-70 family RNA polymerase sigma factor [bacterium]
MEDRELVQKLLAKDDQAYRYFYGTYRDRIYRASVYLLGYRDPEAEDVTQEVFLAALQHLPQFEFRSSLYHWLYRICMYQCYERIRKRRRQVASLQEELEAASQAGALRDHDGPEEEAEKQVLLDLLEKQRALLGDPCRQLLDLWDVQKRSYAQMADALKVPIGTIMSRLSRCKAALKELFLKALKERPNG